MQLDSLTQSFEYSNLGILNSLSELSNPISQKNLHNYINYLIFEFKLLMIFNIIDLVDTVLILKIPFTIEIMI